MQAFTEFLKALKSASLPAILIFAGLYALGLKELPDTIQLLVQWTGFSSFASGVLWSVGIGLGKVTNWPPLLRLNEPKKPSRKALPKA